MLRLQEVHTHYGAIEALRGISLSVEKKEMVALIGANGAGKSTCLLTISGIVRRSKGKIFFEEREIDGLSPEEIVRLGISQVPEGRRIFPKLSVLENLEMGAFLLKNKKEIEKRLGFVYEIFPVLKERRGQKGGTLSGGEQQMLAIARALMSKPKLLLLDEPSLGLSPILVEKIFDIIEKIRQEGTTVLLVEQNAQKALTLADRAYVLENGKIVLEGKGKSLLEDKKVKEAYLGI
ncbi:MAG: ABC transporter ATP-binding protein [Candidatus Edwardsbacteria bacterium]